MPKRKNLRVSYWNHSMGTIPPFPNEGYKTIRLRSHHPDRLLERDVFIQSKKVEFPDQQRGDQKNDQNDAVQQKRHIRMDHEQSSHMGKQEGHRDHPEKCRNKKGLSLDIGKPRTITYQVERKERDQPGKEDEQRKVILFATLGATRDLPENLPEEGDPERPGDRKTGHRSQHSPDEAVQAAPKRSKQHPGGNCQRDIRDLADDDGYGQEDDIDQGSEIAETGQERFDPVRREIVENTLLPEEIDRDACRQDGDADNDIPRVCPIFTAQRFFLSCGPGRDVPACPLEERPATPMSDPASRGFSCG